VRIVSAIYHTRRKKSVANKGSIAHSLYVALTFQNVIALCSCFCGNASSVSDGDCLELNCDLPRTRCWIMFLAGF